MLIESRESKIGCHIKFSDNWYCLQIYSKWPRIRKYFYQSIIITYCKNNYV